MPEREPGAPPQNVRSRVTIIDIARALFLIAAIGFGWWGLRSHWPEIVDSAKASDPARVAVACVLVVVGLAGTSVVWRTLLASFGHRGPVRDESAIFFVGQLGKYIPGSVWAIGAQADMARRLGVPPRTTVAVGLLFLWVHLTTAVPMAGLAGEGSTWALLDDVWARVALAVAALAAMTPPVLSWLGGLLAGAGELRMRWRTALLLWLLMGVVWVLYGAALALVVPPGALAPAGEAHAVVSLVGAFALAYIVGVVVIIAPAGVGAREATLLALLSPTLGLPVAAATALLIRVVHTVCDFGIAAIAWAVAPRPQARSGTLAEETSS